MVTFATGQGPVFGGGAMNAVAWSPTPGTSVMWGASDVGGVRRYDGTKWQTMGRPVNGVQDDRLVAAVLPVSDTEAYALTRNGTSFAGSFLWKIEFVAGVATWTEYGRGLDVRPNTNIVGVVPARPRAIGRLIARRTPGGDEKLYLATLDGVRESVNGGPTTPALVHASLSGVQCRSICVGKDGVDDVLYVGTQNAGIIKISNLDTSPTLERLTACPRGEDVVSPVWSTPPTPPVRFYAALGRGGVIRSSGDSGPWTATSGAAPDEFRHWIKVGDDTTADFSNFEIGCQAFVSGWNASPAGDLVANWSSSNKFMRLRLNGRRLRLDLWNGAAVQSRESPIQVTASVEPKWVRARRIDADGELVFEESIDGIVWTSLGTIANYDDVPDVPDVPQPWTVGAISGGTTKWSPGTKIYRAWISFGAELGPSSASDTSSDCHGWYDPSADRISNRSPGIDIAPELSNDPSRSTWASVDARHLTSGFEADRVYAGAFNPEAARWLIRIDDADTTRENASPTKIADLTTITETGGPLYVASYADGGTFRPDVGDDGDWMPPERRLGGNNSIPSVDGVSAISIKQSVTNDELAIAAETGSVYCLPAGQAGPSATNQWSICVNGFEIISYSQAHTIDPTPAAPTGAHDVLASLADWDAFSLQDDTNGVLDPDSIERLPIPGAATGWCAELTPYENGADDKGGVWLLASGDRDDNTKGTLRARRRLNATPTHMTSAAWGSASDTGLPDISGLVDGSGNQVQPRVTGVVGYHLIGAVPPTVRLIAVRNGARAGIKDPPGGPIAIPPIIWADAPVQSLGNLTWNTATVVGGGAIPDDAYKPRVGHTSIVTVGDPNRGAPVGTVPAIYVYLRSSGLWYSTDGGQSWEQIKPLRYEYVWNTEASVNPPEGYLAADHADDVVYCSVAGQVHRIRNASQPVVSQDHKTIGPIAGVGPIAVEPSSGRLYAVRLSSGSNPANVFQFNDPNHNDDIGIARTKEMIGDTELIRRDLIATSAAADKIAADGVGDRDRVIVTSQGDGIAALVGNT